MSSASYRTPTGAERYIQGGTTYYSNPSLKPTANTEVDAGIAWQQGRKKTRQANNYSDNLGQIAPLKSRVALNYNNSKPFDQADTGLFGTFEWVHSNAATDIDASAGEKPLGA